MVNIWLNLSINKILQLIKILTKLQKWILVLAKKYFITLINQPTSTRLVYNKTLD